MKTATSTTLAALALAMTAAARPFVPILARMPARVPTEYYARDAAATLPDLAAQAQELNAKFDGLRLADACTSGEKACVQGTSATCVDGKWAGDDCPNGMRCFALPDLSQSAVILTCTSKTDAKSRIDAAAQAGPAMEQAADATATEDGECPDETDAPSSTGADGPSSTGADAPSSTDAGAPAPTSTTAPAGAGGSDDGDDEDCPAEDDNDAGNDGADGDSCEDDNDTDTDAPLTPTVAAPESSTALPVPASSTDAPLPTTTDAPLPPTTTPAPSDAPEPEPEPIETVTSVVIILPPQTLGGSTTTTTLTPDEASAVLSSLGLSTGLHTSSTIVRPSQTGAPVDGGYEGGYGDATTSSAPASTATADDGDFITPILPVPGASEGAAAPPAVTIS